MTLIEDEIRRLERLVGDFLSFARPRPLDLTATALAEVCEEVLTLVKPEADGAGVSLELELGRDLPALKADAERMRQVLHNLLRNAIEATTGGGRVTLRVRSAPESGQLEIEVEDTGPGFSEEAPVFDAFFTTKPRGTGLGLSIVHRIVSDHGGTVKVRSRPGRTCFTICLPVVGPR